MKNKLQDSSQEVVESVENGANYFSNKAKKVEKNVGEAVNIVKKVANPMKWSCETRWIMYTQFIKILDIKSFKKIIAI